MATQGEVFSKEKIRTIKATYYRTALDLVERYSNDATMNGLKYKRHTEGASVEMFAENIMQAGYDFLNPDNSMDTPFMPSWKRVVSAVPDVYEQLVAAVEADHEEFSSAGSSAPSLHPQVAQFKEKLTQHVTRIYGSDEAEKIAEGLIVAAELTPRDLTIKPTGDKWNEDDVLMITYGDIIRSEGESPLNCLRRFLKGSLRDTISGVHILPFNPYSSDDGFSVIDYDEVDPDLGNWTDIGKIGAKFDLMADLVINHCSSRSVWFQQFLKGKAPGKDYFIDGSKFENLQEVVRPRSSHLLTKFKTDNGEKEVWTTFSADQVDLDFSNPEVLKEMVKVVANFMRKGARIIRLDAIAFLWKEDGTSCVHLPQTHEVVKLLRVIVEGINPRGVIITETNVPNEENLSYFGNDNEAHLVYNFSLPPLLVYALLSGDSRHLTAWNMSMPPARPGRAYFNFIASHDGIGLRPAEGLLADEELEALKETLKSFGGEISMRKTPEGDLKAYEANIALYSAMAGKIGGEPDGWQMERFICAHTIMLALEGLPAFYIHSILATENDRQYMAETGQARSINRRKWDEKELQEALNDSGRHHGKVFKELSRRIQLRKKQAAFHPNATQYTLQFGEKVFGVWRESLDRTQSVFAIHNISDQPVSIPLVELSLAVTDQWCDLLTGACLTETSQSIDLQPYGAVWISNR